MTYFPCGSSIAQVPFPLLNNVLLVNIRVIALQELIGYEKQGDIYYLISTEHVIQYWVMTDAPGRKLRRVQCGGFREICSGFTIDVLVPLGAESECI
jgi:hypothetical protein